MCQTTVVRQYVNDFEIEIPARLIVGKYCPHNILSNHLCRSSGCHSSGCLHPNTKEEAPRRKREQNEETAWVPVDALQEERPASVPFAHQFQGGADEVARRVCIPIAEEEERQGGREGGEGGGEWPWKGSSI